MQGDFQMPIFWKAVATVIHFLKWARCNSRRQVRIQVARPRQSVRVRACVCMCVRVCTRACQFFVYTVFVKQLLSLFLSRIFTFPILLLLTTILLFPNLHQEKKHISTLYFLTLTVSHFGESQLKIHPKIPYEILIWVLDRLLSLRLLHSQDVVSLGYQHFQRWKDSKNKTKTEIRSDRSIGECSYQTTKCGCRDHRDHQGEQVQRRYLGP